MRTYSISYAPTACRRVERTYTHEEPAPSAPSELDNQQKLPLDARIAVDPEIRCLVLKYSNSAG